jgi:hypothetical protein
LISVDQSINPAAFCFALASAIRILPPLNLKNLSLK